MRDFGLLWIRKTMFWIRMRNSMRSLDELVTLLLLSASLICVLPWLCLHVCVSVCACACLGVARYLRVLNCELLNFERREISCSAADNTSEVHAQRLTHALHNSSNLSLIHVLK